MVFHEEALYHVYVPLPLPFTLKSQKYMYAQLTRLTDVSIKRLYISCQHTRAVAVWCDGSAPVLISNNHSAPVNARIGRRLGTLPTTQVNSAWPSLRR